MAEGGGLSLLHDVWGLRWKTRRAGSSSIARNWNLLEASSPPDLGITGLLTQRVAQGSMGKLRGLR